MRGAEDLRGLASLTVTVPSNWVAPTAAGMSTLGWVFTSPADTRLPSDPAKSSWPRRI